MAVDTATLLAAYGIILVMILWGADKIFDFGDRRLQNTLNFYVYLKLAAGAVNFVVGLYLWYALSTI